MVESLLSQETSIVIDAEVVAEVGASWERRMGRPPNADELSRALNLWLEEELMYRQAIALGMNQDDPIIRRRLIQKMGFMVESSANPLPSETELKQWFEQRQSNYRVSGSISLKLCPVPNELSNLDAEVLVATCLADEQLEYIGSASEDQLTLRFGQSFVEALQNYEVSQLWQGPVATRLGQFLVQLTARSESQLPEFAVLRQRIAGDYRLHQQRQARREYLQELKQLYPVAWRTE